MYAYIYNEKILYCVVVEGRKLSVERPKLSSAAALCRYAEAEVKHSKMIYSVDEFREVISDRQDK
jgi:hypothetical protein